MKPLERLSNHALRALMALPPRLQVRLSGRSPTSLDGQTLAPDIQLLLALDERLGAPPLASLTPAEARAGRLRFSRVLGGAPARVGSVRELEIAAEVPLPARQYLPLDASPRPPLLIYFHGGGFFFGDLDTHDAVCRLLCRHSGASVLAVDYRLAPEHPFPAAVEDARAALAWAFEHAGELGVDPRRIGVGGDSAGGNLSAVVSQMAARDGGPAPALQLLIYPALDMSRRRRSRELFAEGFLLTDPEMDFFEATYLGGELSQAHDPRASPLLSEDLAGLPPAIVITAGFDPLRDEGEEYARALLAAGTPASLRRFPGFVHAFVSLAGISRSCALALAEIAGMTRATFELRREYGSRRGEHDAQRGDPADSTAPAPA